LAVEAELSKRAVSAIRCKNIAALVLVPLLALLISGCGSMMNVDNRRPLNISPLDTSLPPNTQKILVRYENTLPGYPLAETVWDNVSGAFSDKKESQQIGYTQNYSKLLPAAAAAGAVGGAIGGAVLGATAGPHLVDTRIVIPFGRIFEDVFESGRQKVFPISSASFDDAAERKELLSPV
jgi:hypothetical protein